MAVAVDATSSQTGNGTSLTWSHTVTASGSNRVLVVTIATESDQVPTGVTYNGVAMTKKIDSDGGIYGVSIWYLANPSTGANNIVASFASSIGCSGNAISLTSGKQTSSATGRSTTAGASSLTLNITTTGAGTGIVIAAMTKSDRSTAVTPGADETELLDVDYGRRHWSAYETYSGGANVSFGPSWSSTDSAILIALEIESDPDTTDYVRSASESVGIIESFLRSVNYPRSRNEDLTVLQSESINRTAQFPRALGTETISITDTTVGLKSRILDILESIPIGDTFSRSYFAVRQPLDSVGLNEIYSRAWQLSRDLSDATGITEIFSIGKAIIRNLSESIGITEIFSTATTYVRSLTLESLGITEIFSKLKSRVLDLLESMTITENNVTTSRVVVFFNRTVSDFVTITEWFATPLNWIKRTRPTAIWTPRQRP